MAFDMIRYERGQIWMIRWKHPTAVGSEQKKDRPWLIVSVGKFNQSSGMVTAVPMTTRDEIRTPSQVRLYDLRGQSSIILCEQIRTFDYRSGEYMFDYMGNVSDEILEQVDVALSIHLGFHYSPITLNKLYQTMESIIKSVAYMQKKADTPKFTDDDICRFTTRLQELATTVSTESIEDHVTAPTEVVLNSEPEEQSTHESLAECSEPTVVKRAKHIRWTPETCSEFLSDAENLPMKQVMIKWNIEKKTRYYSMKNYVKNLLEKWS